MGRRRFPIWVSGGLLAPEHYRAMGIAVWTFLWLVDHQTDACGTVLGGRQVPAEEIAGAIGMSRDTAIRHLERLKTNLYIDLRGGNRGYYIRILNPKKTFRSDRAEMPHPDTARMPCPDRAEIPYQGNRIPQECPTGQCMNAIPGKATMPQHYHDNKSLESTTVHKIMFLAEPETDIGKFERWFTTKTTRQPYTQAQRSDGSIVGIRSEVESFITKHEGLENAVRISGDEIDRRWKAHEHTKSLSQLLFFVSQQEKQNAATDNTDAPSGLWSRGTVKYRPS